MIALGKWSFAMRRSFATNACLVSPEVTDRSEKQACRAVVLAELNKLIRLSTEPERSRRRARDSCRGSNFRAAIPPLPQREEQTTDRDRRALLTAERRARRAQCDAELGARQRVLSDKRRLRQRGRAA